MNVGNLPGAGNAKTTNANPGQTMFTSKCEQNRDYTPPQTPRIFLRAAKTSETHIFLGLIHVQ